MKKLTAGIFTVLLGLVTVNAADAAVASKLYVDQEVGGVATGLSNYVTSNDSRVLAVEGEVDTLQGQVADETNGLIKKVTDLRAEMDNVKGGQLNITDGAVTTDKIADGNVTAAKLAENAAVTNIGYTPENVANKTTTIDANSTEAQYPTAKAVYTQIDQVQKDVGDNLTLIQELQTKSATKAELATYQETDVAAFQALTKTVADNAAAATSALSEAKAELEGKITTASGGASEALEEYKTSNDAAVQANAAEIETIKKSDAMTSGVNSGVVSLVTTNADNIGAIAQSEYIQSLPENEQTLTGAVDNLAGRLTTAESNVTQALTDAKSYTDAEIARLNLNELSRVPAECSAQGKYCVLTSNGTNFYWEAIERADNESQPTGEPIPAVTSAE